MQLIRPVIAIDSARFGKRPAREPTDAPEARTTLGDDLRLFATTFVAGFLVVSILIG